MTRKTFFRKGKGGEVGKWFLWSLSNTKCDICDKEQTNIIFAMGLIFPKKATTKYLCFSCKNKAKFMADHIEETQLIITSIIPKDAKLRIIAPTHPRDMFESKRLIDCPNTQLDDEITIDKTKYAGRPEYTLGSPDNVQIGKDITQELNEKDNFLLDSNKVEQLLINHKNSKSMDKEIKQLNEGKNDNKKT